ncbi:glutathione-disulfide reductase [Xanthobacteraceae bacterium Astr-EGSB]|uniref:glutathione-disulfide reductase n=1 Tax=Astrobacterium formosum TaxID=3069710 RepID=UPI0027B0E17D|nr:glutathione-disulfide reductase [Xanthobacteraceae bacterium Astr-EGSB]
MTDAAAADIDLFVIGAGSGGVRAARVAAGYGARVMIAEEYRVGGTCVIRGCVPKKLLVYASRYFHEFEDAAGYGWTLPPPSFDWPTLIANKDREIERLERAYVATLEKAGVAIVRSRAVIEDANTVRLTATGERVRARHILVATGAVPHEGHVIPGLEYVISSNEVFHLPELPRRVLVQGGGYIAVEFACIFAGFGTDVTLVYRGENILRGFDDDVRTHLRTEMERRAIKVVTGQIVTAVEAKDGGYRAQLSGGDAIACDRVMFAIGRRPNVADIGLENAGVTCGQNGGIEVDAFSRTCVPSIYAVGDVTNRVNLTPVAIREGHAFADTVFGARPTAVDHADIPTAVFSEPEIGVIGLTETQARERLDAVDIYKAVFRPMKATLSGRETRILLKLVVDAGNDRVVGAHIVGEGAAEMIQVLGIAVRMRATKKDFDATMAVHPTAAEELVTLRQPFAQYRREAAE